MWKIRIICLKPLLGNQIAANVKIKIATVQYPPIPSHPTPTPKKKTCRGLDPRKNILQRQWTWKIIPASWWSPTLCHYEIGMLTKTRHINSSRDHMCKPETETDESFLLNMGTRYRSWESILCACNERVKKLEFIYRSFLHHTTDTCIIQILSSAVPLVSYRTIERDET